MKVTQTHLRIAVLCLGGLLILYGLVKLIWKVDFGPWVEQNVPNGIFLGAAAIFVWNRSLYNKERKLKDEEAAKKDEPEEPKKDL
jgi:hypothetical protein